ncbi:cilia- and flagella-associated protein 263 isoform X1 [Nothobranchius furzeri]|uniref:Cilia- and flagella-associated protein 263 n=3 Tax=Nothobranchius TaxID=28779 RepID=A0A9D2YQK1_NOTFU|nr:coiled-coil domain-containing protein 113 isoform X1 [Nothobranchius furzeri]KAF7224856.1 transcript variant X1 [Nothobranchius furzeri]
MATTESTTMEDKMKENTKKVTEEHKTLLVKHQKDLRDPNVALLAENHVFECFIKRLDPKEFQGDGGEGQQAAGHSQLDCVNVDRRQKPRYISSDCDQLLTLEQKIFLIQREITDTRKDHEELKQKYEKIQDNYKAAVKEAELRLAEIRKSKKEFEHRLMKSMKDGLLEMKEPEKVLQYTEDRSKIVQLERFNLKNQALKVQEKTLLQKLLQKNEMEKAEYQVYFLEYDEPRFDRSLDEHRCNYSKVQHVLSVHKEKLQSVMLVSAELSNDISKRKLMLAKIEQEIHHAEKERLKVEDKNRLLREQLAHHQAPGITEYVCAKDKHKKLQQSIHKWETKVGVAEMALKTHRRKWSQQRAISSPESRIKFGITSSGDCQSPVKLPHIAETNT